MSENNQPKLNGSSNLPTATPGGGIIRTTARILYCLWFLDVFLLLGGDYLLNIHTNNTENWFIPITLATLFLAIPVDLAVKPKSKIPWIILCLVALVVFYFIHSLAVGLRS